ncbi:MAG: PilZ domain-containing protein [Xanthobacteraceae bacterium]
MVAVGAYPNRTEQRKSPRRHVFFRATISDATNNFLCECQMLDISGGGARLTVKSQDCVPDTFILRLRRSGDRKCCSVVWRAGDQIGVEFLRLPSL